LEEKEERQPSGEVSFVSYDTVAGRQETGKSKAPAKRKSTEEAKGVCPRCEGERTVSLRGSQPGLIRRKKKEDVARRSDLNCEKEDSAMSGTKKGHFWRREVNLKREGGGKKFPTG